jgi:hypothetical protein
MLDDGGVGDGKLGGWSTGGVTQAARVNVKAATPKNLARIMV